jgi:arylmalonate decarboxylase
MPWTNVMRKDRNIRVGVLVPAGNVIHEREFVRLQMESVDFRFVSFSYPPAGSTNFCGDLTAQMAAPIAELKSWDAQAILIGCTTASMTCASDEWNARLEQLANAPVITAADASRQAIAAMGLKSVAVATPYGESSNIIVSTYLRANVVEVTTIKGLGLDSSLETWCAKAPLLSTQEILDFSLSIDSYSAQAIYLPCTGIGSLEALDQIEKKTGKPALSSVQAGYWAILRRLGISGRTKGFGRLIEIWDF